MDSDRAPGGAVDATGTPVSARHADLQRLLAYWRVKCNGRDFPKRADVDPIDLWFMLDRIALTEIHDGDKRRHRLRVVGSWWTRLLGFDPTGLWLEDWPTPGQLQLTTSAYAAVIALRRPMLASRDAWVDERKLSYEIMLLPMSEDGKRISMIMTGIGPR